MIEEIVKLQDKLNIKTAGDEWKTKGLAWDFAMLAEATELIESLNLKWWKSTDISIKTNTYDEVLSESPIDLQNIHVELVDIFHFLISDYLTKYSEEDVISFIKSREHMIYTPKIQPTIGTYKLHIFNKTKEFIHKPSMTTFFTLVSACGLSKDELYSLYLGKNILNGFRQDNGYSTGEYKKLWNGVEDNVVMYENIMHYHVEPEELYHELTMIYKGLRDG